MESRYIVDEIGAIVTLVSGVMSTRVAPFACYYQHGNPLEIVDNLKAMISSSTHEKRRFPMVALLQDFDEDINAQGKRVVDLNLIIANITDKTYTAAQRYEYSFKPYLYPIYNEFLNQLSKSGYFVIADASRIQHKKIDRVFWGRQELYGAINPFTDAIDAIEIQDLQLVLTEKINCYE